MNRIKSVLSLILMGSGTFALISVGLFFLHLTRTADQLTKDSGTTLAALKDTATEATGAISYSRKQLEDGRKQWEAFSKVALPHIDRAIGEAAIASRQQRVYWEDISKKTATVLESANETIQGLNDTQRHIASDFHANSGHLNTALDGIPPILEETNKTMAAAHVTLDSLNATVSDPSIKASLQNINTTTANVADSSGDIKVAIHRWTRPASVLKSLFTNLLGIGVKARAFF